MSTFKVRVEDKIGDVGDDVFLTDALTAGGKYITNLLPIERLERHSAGLTDSGSGVSVTSHRIIRANKSNYGARRVDANMSALVQNVNSIHYATSTDPVWYISNGLAVVKPGGGTIVGMPYPTVAYGDSSIAGFPSDLDEGVVLYASIQGRLRQLSDLAITTIGGLSFSAQVAPSAPVAPSFSYNEATPELISATTVSFSDTLTYTPPVFSGSYTNADTALTNQDIDLANAHLSKVQAQLEQMQKDLLISLNDFNKDKGEFDANLQKALTDAQLAQTRLIQEAELSTNVNLQNAIKEYEKEVSEYQAKLSLYGQQMNGYQAEVQQEVQRISAKLNQYNSQSQILFQGLQSIRNEFNEFLKAI